MESSDDEDEVCEEQSDLGRQGPNPAGQVNEDGRELGKGQGGSGK